MTVHMSVRKVDMVLIAVRSAAIVYKVKVDHVIMSPADVYMAASQATVTQAAYTCVKLVSTARGVGNVDCAPSAQHVTHLQDIVHRAVLSAFLETDANRANLSLTKMDHSCLFFSD